MYVVFSWGCCHKVPHTGRLKQQIYSYTVLEATRLRSRCRQGGRPSCLARPRVAFLGLWLHLFNLYFCRPMAFISLCLCVSLLLRRTPVTLIQYNLILINDICKDCISKYVHILRFWVDLSVGGHHLTFSRWTEREGVIGWSSPRSQEFLGVTSSG